MIHHETIGDGPNTAWILHGILGSGRNWRSFARRLAKAHPDWTFVLPDLRNHGQTGPLPGPHRLSDCAADLTALPSPRWVMGHSFGGKVALTWARDHGTDQSVWVLDSVPFADRAGDSEVLGVLSALEKTTVPVPDRRDLREQLENQGLAGFLIDWLLTSAHEIETGNGVETGWTWVYDLPAIRQMMTSYFTTDFGADLEQWSGTRLHVVRAARSDRWRPEWLARLAEMPIDLQTLPDAGHWLHVDNPRGLLDMLHPG